MIWNCPTCGKFCKNIKAIMDGFENIIKVTGECKKCGIVDLTNSDWCYEDFVREEE